MKYKVAKSKIHGDGIFATQPIAKGEYISDTPDYIDDVNQTIASSFNNHDEKNANVLNVKRGNKRFLIAKRGIEVGEELTTDYNLTPSPPFEDPNDFKNLDERELSLSDEEVQEMIDAGYELEELHEGGEPGHTHDPPDYEELMKAYKDSIAAKEAYEKQYALDLKDYEKNKVNAKAKYDKDLRRYNDKWDTYRDNKAYIEYLSNKFDYLPKSFDDPMLDNLEPAEWNSDSWRNDKGHRSVRNKDGKEFAHMIDHTLWEPLPGMDPDNFLDRFLILWDDASVKDYANRKLNNVVTTDTKLYAPPSDHPEWNTFYTQFGNYGESYPKNVIEMYGKPTQKKPSLDEYLKKPEYNPPVILEKPEIPITKLDIIQPEFLSNDTEIPELEEREEVEGIDYKRKFGVWLEDKATKTAHLKKFFKYTLPEFFNDKPSRNTWYYRTPKRIRAGFYNKPIEDEQLYPEGFVPMFEDGGPHDPPLFKEFLGEEPGTFTTENFQDKDGYNLELLYPRTNMKRRPTRFGYDDYDKGYTEITKGDENYRGIKKELKPIVKQEFKEQKLKKRFPREEYYTGNKTYKPSQEFLDQVAYQAAHKDEDKMGDTDVLVNMIYDDLNLQGFDIGTNTGTRKQRKLAQRLEHSPEWYAANALKERDALGVSMPIKNEGGPTVKQRRGVRKNPDGSVSTHLMRAEYIPERGWVAFPSLFQDSKPYADDQQNWVDMSEEEDWMKIYEEAERRGEVYDFGEDKEAALAFGMGSWKDEAIQSPEAWEQEIRRVEREIGHPRGWTMDDYHMMQDKLNEYKAWRERHPEVIDHSNEPNEYVVPLPPHLNADQYIDIELTDEEVEQYKAGGYILEELEHGGPIEIDLTPEQVKMYKNGGYVLEELPTYNGGGKFLANKVAPVFIEPGVKLIETFFPTLGRSVGSKISRMSLGNAQYNLNHILSDLNKNKYFDYFGQAGMLNPSDKVISAMGEQGMTRLKDLNRYYGEDKRDLIRQYFFGDSNKMPKTDWKSYLEGDNPLADIIKRHGELDAFKMLSSIRSDKPVNAYELAEQMLMRVGTKYKGIYDTKNPIYDSKAFKDATGYKIRTEGFGHTPIGNVFLDNKEGLIDIYENLFNDAGTKLNVLPFDVEPASMTRNSIVKPPARTLSYNPIKPYDDIAGHMAYLERHGPGDYSLTSRDLWHFTPSSYKNKWLYDKQQDYLKTLPSRLMDKFGKPFILTQTNPISFDFNLFKNPTKSRLKLKKGGLVRFNDGGGIDSKLKVKNSYSKEQIDDYRLRYKKLYEENPDLPKASFEEWFNFILMDQRTENNPNAEDKFTHYMVINEDGTGSVYDGQEIQNRIWKHGRRAQQLIDAGLPEGDHSFLQEHFKRAEKDGEIRYMNHIKKGLNQGMSMDEIKKDMLDKNLISEVGWNEKYEGKTTDHINTEYDKLKTEIEQSQAAWKKRVEAVGSKIDPALMDVEQLQMDSYGAYRYQKPKPAPKVKYQRIAGTASYQPIIDPSTIVPNIPQIPDPNAVSLGEQLYNKSVNTGPFITEPSWNNLSEVEKSTWNMRASAEDLQKRNQAIDKERDSYTKELINQEYINDQQEIYDNTIQLDPNGKYIGEGLMDFDENKDPSNYVPFTEQEITNNELDAKRAYINAIRNAEYSDKFKEKIGQRLMPSNYLKVNKDYWGRESLTKGNLQDNINTQAAAQEYMRNLNNQQGSGRISIVYPEKLFMGPSGSSFAGLTKNLVGKGFRGLGKILQKNPINWASRNLVGKELPGWLNYATTPGNVLMGDFAYESFKPDGMVSNFAQGIQDVVNEVPGGRKKIIENSWPLLFGPSVLRGGKNLIRGINEIRGAEVFMPTASNSRFGNYALRYTSPSGNTIISRANPDYVASGSKNFKPSFEFNFPGIGRFQGARYTQPTATGYTRSTSSSDPFGSGNTFSLNASGTPSSSTSGSGFSFGDLSNSFRPTVGAQSMNMGFGTDFNLGLQNFKNTLFPSYTAPTSSDVKFRPTEITRVNPKTGLNEIYRANLPDRIVPGRSYEDVKHKMSNLYRDLGYNSILGPKTSFNLERLLPGSNNEISLVRDSGITYNPQSGSLFDSNSRYWANRRLGITPSPDQFHSTMQNQIIDDQSEFVGFAGSDAKPGINYLNEPLVSSYDTNLRLGLTSEGKRPFSGFSINEPYMTKDALGNINISKGKGRTMSYDDANEFYTGLGQRYPSLNIESPSVYFHGTTSATLPGFMQQQGLMNQGDLLNQGVVPAAGENFIGAQGMNQSMLSTVFGTDISNATRYSLMGNNTNPQSDFQNWWTEGRMKYLQDRGESSMMPEAEYYDKLYTDRVTQFENASDVEKTFLSENFPIMFGINPRSGDASRFVIPRSDISGEVGIKGKLDFGDVPQIFVPRSRMQVTKDYLGNDFQINPIDPFFQNMDWRNKWQQEQWKKLGYKKGGGIEINLSPEDVQKYIDEGYILEEIN